MHQENRPPIRIVSDIAHRPLFTSLHGHAAARRWQNHLAADIALWRQGARAWSDTQHACIAHGPVEAEKFFAEDIAGALGIDCIALDAPGWRDANWQSAVAAIVAIVAAFDDAARNAPCVLSFDAVNDLSAPAGTNALYFTAVTAALRAEIEDAWHVPGLVLVGTAPACAAIALSLVCPVVATRLQTLPLSLLASPANDNDAVAAADPPGTKPHARSQF